MTDCFTPQVFIRHHRQLRALQLDHQAWFCLQDIARLMGKALDKRSLRKLDADQHRIAWLNNDGLWSKQVLISESALFAMLVHHYVPENRVLRQWLTHEVLPALRGRKFFDLPEVGEAPGFRRRDWMRRCLRALTFQRLLLARKCVGSNASWEVPKTKKTAQT